MIEFIMAVPKPIDSDNGLTIALIVVFLLVVYALTKDDN